MRLQRAHAVSSHGEWHLSPVGLRLARIRPAMPRELTVSAKDSAAWQAAVALLEAGLAVPVAPSGAPPSTTVVIPTRNPDPGPLEHLVADACRLLPDARVIVVDDGSVAPVAVPAPAQVLRHELPLGPGAARNRGAALAEGEVLLFVDADVARLPDDLPRALSLLRHPEVVALAPRIVGAGGPDPLDLGPHPAAVSRRTRIGHLPACVLAVRTSAFDAAGGFDETLRLGEDVALVQRLTSAGGLALYLGELHATHAARPLLARLGRAFAYGYSVAGLRDRVPRVLPSAPMLAVMLAELLPGGPLLVPSLVTLGLAVRSRPADPRLLPMTFLRGLEELSRLATRHGAVALGLLSRRTRPQVLLLATIVALAAGPEALAFDLAYGLGMASGLLLEPR